MTLVYDAQVYVEVDTDSEEVLKVVVDDENCKLRINSGGIPESDAAAGLKDRIDAGDIAENPNVLWPAWGFGF